MGRLAIVVAAMLGTWGVWCAKELRVAALPESLYGYACDRSRVKERQVAKSGRSRGDLCHSPGQSTYIYGTGIARRVASSFHDQEPNQGVQG